MGVRNFVLVGGALAFSVAQQSSAADTTPARNSDIEEVEVLGRYTLADRIDTATGLGLTVRETPQSVTIITEQRILDQNLDTVADVIENAAGVSVNEVDDVRNTFNSRGFVIQNYQVDGVPLAWTLAGGAGETIADASLYERIEIVRGATGLLTGAGDPSASINLVRKHADSKEFRGRLDASFGSWSNWQLSADIGGAVTDSGRIRARAVAKYEQGESYIDLFEKEKLVLYGVVDTDVTDSTLLRVGASHQKNTPTAPAWGALPSFFADGGFASWSRSKTTSADWTYWDTTNQNVFVNLTQRFGDDWQLVANYNWLRNAQTTEILYLSGLVDRTSGEGLFSFPYKDDGESIQNSVDVQLKGAVGLFGREHEVVVGALYSKQKRDNTTFGALDFPSSGNYFNWNGAAYPYPGFSTTGTLEVDEDVEQKGLYAVMRFNVTDALKLIGGGRLSSYQLDGFNFGPQRDYGENAEFIEYIGALYDLNAQHRLYASYTGIFQPQDARDRNGRYLPSVKGKSAEIGLKSAFLDEAVQTSLAVFRTKQDNLAQPDIGFFVPGVTPPAQASFAAEGATSEGFEAEVTGQPVLGWNLSLAYSQFSADDANGAPVNTDHPRKLLKLFTTYELSSVVQGLTVGGGVNWRSKNYSDGDNPVTGAPFRFQQDAYALVSLMARYVVSESLQFQANAENLLDKSYYSQIGFYSQYRYGDPRNFTVGATYRF